MDNEEQLDIEYVASLARIDLTAEQGRLFGRQLSDVLKYVETLQELDVSNVEVAAHGLPIFDVFREDEPRQWLTAEQALGNAPRKANDLFIVPKVVE